MKLPKFLKFDPRTKLLSEVQMQFYEAQASYISAVQQKQYVDSQLDYLRTRLATLNRMLESMKHEEEIAIIDVSIGPKPIPGTDNRIKDAAIEKSAKVPSGHSIS